MTVGSLYALNKQAIILHLSTSGKHILSPWHSSKILRIYPCNQDIKKSGSRLRAFPGPSKPACGSNSPPKNLKRIYICLDSSQKGFCYREMCLNYTMRMPCQHFSKIQTKKEMKGELVHWKKVRDTATNVMFELSWFPFKWTQGKINRQKKKQKKIWAIWKTIEFLNTDWMYDWIYNIWSLSLDNIVVA